MKTKKEFISDENKEYFDYFFQLTQGSYKDCWIITEKWFQETYNKTKYTSYSSFRKAKSNYLNGLYKRRRGK